jgi:CspA family cold shock protein
MSLSDSRTVEVAPGSRHDRSTAASADGSGDDALMAANGVVREWRDEEGWGVIDASDTPGGCWAHYSVVLVPGYQTLSAGQAVTFHYESAEQDGYQFRAAEVWPSEQQPDRSSIEVSGPSNAYRSRLTIKAESSGGPRAT